MWQALPQYLDLRPIGGWPGRGAQPKPSVESIPAHSPSLSLSWQLPTGCPGDRLSLTGWISVGLPGWADGCRVTINFLPEAAHSQNIFHWSVFHSWAPLFIK